VMTADVNLAYSKQFNAVMHLNLIISHSARRSVCQLTAMLYPSGMLLLLSRVDNHTVARRCDGAESRGCTQGV